MPLTHYRAYIHYDTTSAAVHTCVWSFMQQPIRYTWRRSRYTQRVKKPIVDSTPFSCRVRSLLTRTIQQIIDLGGLRGPATPVGRPRRDIVAPTTASCDNQSISARSIGEKKSSACIPAPFTDWVVCNAKSWQTVGGRSVLIEVQLFVSFPSTGEVAELACLATTIR